MIQMTSPLMNSMLCNMSISTYCNSMPSFPTFSMNNCFMPNSIFSMPMMSSFQMPMMPTFSMPAFQMPMFQMPMFNFSFGFNFGSISSVNTGSKGDPSSKETSLTVKTPTDSGKTKSAFKQGLFKGALAGKEELVTRICRKYNVSPAVVASIIGLESGWGTSNLAQRNNFGGYRAQGDEGRSNKGFGYFSTAEKGLEAMIKNLASYPQRYSDVTAVDFDNIVNIGKHYCNANWGNKVKEMYNSRVSKYLA